MKKVLPILLIAVLFLSGCGVINPSPSEPTPSDEQLATRVADILTAMPSPTVAVQPTTAPTVALPTEEPTAAPTATLEPTAAPTATVKAAGVQSSKPSKTPKPTATKAPPTPTAPPTSTIPASDLRNHLGDPSFSDKMDNGNNWPSGIDRKGFTSVDYQDGYMRLTSLKTKSGWRLSRYGTDIQSFYVEMRFTTGECTGDDRYGIIFHVPYPSRPDQGYWYGFTCDGRYAMQMWDALDGPDGTVTNLVYWTASDAINAGPNATNRMGLLVEGSRFTMYANGVRLGEARQGTWLRGAFGVFVGGRETQGFTIMVDQMDVWKMPDTRERPWPYTPRWTPVPTWTKSPED